MPGLRRCKENRQMLDILYVAVAAAFFLLSASLVRAAERLR
jgi:hypothetical protein